MVNAMQSHVTELSALGAALTEVKSEQDVTPALVHRLVAASVRLYVQEAQRDRSLAPLAKEHRITQTDVATVALALLEAGDIEIFELAMWRAWAGRS
jgi:hypothetical protein